MEAAESGTLHIRSTRVLIDGHVTAATVRITRTEGVPPTFLDVVADDAPPAGAPVLELGDAPVVPAPLDLHLHGCGGFAVAPGDTTAQVAAALVAATAADPAHVTQLPAPAYDWVATLPVPAVEPQDPVAHLAAAAADVAAHAASGASPSARCVGLRLEGLFLNPTRAGIWPPGAFRPLDVSLLEELHAAAREARSSLRIVDIAPELGTSAQVAAFVGRARELGIVVSLAHTDATWEQARVAIDAGATLATHLWNAMRPVAHRDPGVIAACLTDDRVVCELICDSAHLHDGTVALTTRAVGAGRWAVISDASPFAGCAPGSYDWAGTTVEHDGSSLRAPDGTLAGSATLAWAARTQLGRAGVPLLEQLASFGAVPRRVLDPTRGLGLEPGDPVWVAAAP